MYAQDLNKQGYAGNAIGPSTAPPPQPQILSVNIDELAICVGQAQQLAMRLGNIADRLIGPEPANGALEKDSQNPTSMPAVARLESTINLLSRVLQAAHIEASRLDRL